MAERRRWNFGATEWSTLLSGVRPEVVADDLAKGKVLPWTKTLLQFTADSETVLDLGSGRGEHSAVLALNGRKTTLLDWSKQNLDFSIRLFNALGIDGQFRKADVTKVWPFETHSFDVVFSCGVLEFLQDEVIRAVLQEAYRVSKKRIIMMVPNAFCVPYRVGMWYMKKAGTWRWGGESPFYTLRPYFRRFPNLRVTEFSVAASHSLNFLTMPKIGKTMREMGSRILGLGNHSGAALLKQGYLLVTVADKV